jgi:hypothetical protein
LQGFPKEAPWLRIAGILLFFFVQFFFQSQKTDYLSFTHTHTHYVSFANRLQYDKRLGGVISCSGYVIADLLTAPLSEANKSIPFIAYHGGADPMVFKKSEKRHVNVRES